MTAYLAILRHTVNRHAEPIIRLGDLVSHNQGLNYYLTVVYRLKSRDLSLVATDIIPAYWIQTGEYVSLYDVLAIDPERSLGAISVNYYGRDVYSLAKKTLLECIESNIKAGSICRVQVIQRIKKQGLLQSALGRIDRARSMHKMP